MHKHAYLMFWLFFAGLGSAVLLELYRLDLLTLRGIMFFDGTGTTLFIIFVFAIGFFFSLSNIVWLEKLILKDERYDLAKHANDIEIEFEARDAKTNYVLWILPILGFVGTLVGVMIISIVLGQKITEEKDILKITEHIQSAISGVKTAAFTSIVGMLASAYLALLGKVFRLGYLKLVLVKIGKESPQ